jgi:hypothetical protein
MIVSEARKAANIANGKRGKGPVSAEGKAVSRRNSLKHGLSGAGVVLPEGDQAEVERRVEGLTAEMGPSTILGSICVRKIAINSVKSERASERENAEIAKMVRVAVLAYDEERAHLADSLYACLPDDPRGAVRNLRRMPEGVDRMIEGWRALRRRLEYDGPAYWSSVEWARAINLTGVRHEDAGDTRVGELSNAIWGDFRALSKDEGGDLDDDGRRDWARVAMKGLIDARIAELEAHRGTIDLNRIEQDRREAPLRCTFDDSKEAQLARRYEADADRGFYRALKEFRQVEAEAQARIEAESTPATPDPIEARMGSFRETSPPAVSDRPAAHLDTPRPKNPSVRQSGRRPARGKRPLTPPG